MECKYCNRTLSSKNNLLTHQKTAKYCIAIQGESANAIIKSCEFCEQNFSAYHMPRHQKTCKKAIAIALKEKKETEQKICQNLFDKKDEEIFFLKQIIEEQKQRIEEQKQTIQQIRDIRDNQEELNNIIDDREIHIKKLNKIIRQQMKIADDYKIKLARFETKSEIYKESAINANNTISDIAKQVKTTKNTINNTVYNNKFEPFTLTKEDSKRLVDEHFEKNDYIDKQHGVANFFIRHVLVGKDKKLTIGCSDTSRNKFYYFDEQGRKISDEQLNYVHSLFHDPLKEKAKHYFGSIKNDKDIPWTIDQYRDILKMDTSRAAFLKQISSHIDRQLKVPTEQPPVNTIEETSPESKNINPIRNITYETIPDDCFIIVDDSE